MRHSLLAHLRSRNISPVLLSLLGMLAIAVCTFSSALAWGLLDPSEEHGIRYVAGPNDPLDFGYSFYHQDVNGTLVDAEVVGVVDGII
jgi:hypothetical protein